MVPNLLMPLSNVDRAPGKVTVWNFVPAFTKPRGLVEPEVVNVPTWTPTSLRRESVVAVELGTLRMCTRPSKAKRTKPSVRPDA